MTESITRDKTFEEQVTERLDKIETELAKVVTFCEKALITAEKLSQHPMMASLFPSGTKRRD